MPQKSETAEMERHLGIASVFAICTGALFSSGFFLLPGLIAEETGPSVVLVYFVAAFLILPAIFSISELSSAIPRSGGLYLFIKRSLGPLFGLQGALGKFIQLVLKGAFAFVGVGAYLSLITELPVKMVASGLVLLFTILNLFGVRHTAKTEIFLVSIILLLLSYFLIGGIAQISTESINFQDTFLPAFPFGVEGFFSALALVFVSFGGIGQVASLSEEIKRPANSIPKGMLIALFTASFFYLVGTAIMVSLISPENLQGDKTPVATAVLHFNILDLPIIIIVIAALAGFTSAGNAAIMSASRYPVALSRDRLVANWLGSLNSKGTPINAILTTGSIMLLLILLFDIQSIAKMASSFLLLIFLGMCIAVIVFREGNINEYQPGYKSPLYPWMQIAGILIYILLIGGSGTEAILFIISILIAGSIWFKYGVKNQNSFSGIIYRLFARIGQKSSQTGNLNESTIPFSSVNHQDLIERAIIIDIDEPTSFDRIIEDAAKAINDHVGGKKEEIKSEINQQVKNWINPEGLEIAVAPVLLKGIEQPELIIIRAKLKKGSRFHGLIVLIDDSKQQTRILNLLSKITFAIEQPVFHKTWRGAKNSEQLKNAFKKEVQIINIQIKETEPTKSLQERSIGSIDLPKGSRIGLIQRKEKVIVPDKETTIKIGDEIFVIVEARAIDELNQKFKLD